MLFRPFLNDATSCASYLFGCGSQAKLAVVDPHADLADDYIATAARLGAPIVAVFETHVQADHVSGLPALVERTGATAYLPAGAGVEFDHVALVDADVVELGNTVVTAIATPGHAPAHHAYAVADRRRGTEEPWLVFSGDSLLIGDVGRPDLHVAGDALGQARVLHASLRRLLGLPDHVVLYPSHYAGSVCGRGLSEPCLHDRLRARAQPAARDRRPGHVRGRADRRDAACAPRPGTHRCRQPLRQGWRRRMNAPVRLGVRANASQFALLVGLNALVGGMVGLERSVLPLVGKQDFGLRSTSTILAFVVAFGAAKAVTNLAAGELAERSGRKRLLVLGWLVALPVPLLIGVAPSWWFIVAANLLLGVNQGLAWSMTVLMKIDLAGPRRRGLALGLNEAAGYLGVAVTAFATGALAASYAPRTVVWGGAALIAAVGLVVSVLAVRDTGPQVALEQEADGDRVPEHAGLRNAFAHASVRDPMLRVCNQAGLVNNLNDALAWGLAPLYLAAHGATVRQIAVVAAAYPVVWGAGQLATGWLSDYTGRKPLITMGMLVQAGALGLLVAGDGAFTPSLAAALLLGVGTAMVYPTLLAAVSDASQPRDRARVVGVYRFWRDFGFVIGAFVAGMGADATSPRTAILIVAVLTGASGAWVAATSWRPRPALRPAPVP